MFLLVLVGLVVALIFALASVTGPAGFWMSFGLAVLLVEWVVLLSAAILCAFRGLIRGWSGSAAGWMVFSVIPLVTLAVSLMVIRFVPFSEGSEPLWFVTRNTLISVLASLALVRYLVLQQQWKRQVAAEAQARLDALQASIRPHFLFNALNTIASLVHDKPEQAEQATLDLSDLLRTGLRSGATESLADELELVRGYLRLEALRLGERLKVSWDLDDELPLDHELPALLIQPLVENAVVHGISRLPGGGTLAIRGEYSRRKRLRFVIENPVPAEDSKAAPGNRTALENIRQRLELAWEEGAHLRTRRDGNTFRVELVIPL